MKIFKYDKNSLEYKEIKTFTYVFVGTLVMAGIIFLSSFIGASTLEQEIRTGEKVIHLNSDTSFSREKLIEEIKRLPFKHKDIIYSQCIVESGNFKSAVFRQNSNLLGMKEAQRRLTTSTGTNLNHATFNNWRDCLLDRLIYESKYTSDLSRKDYLKYLDETYAEIGGYDVILEETIRRNNLKQLFE